MPRHALIRVRMDRRPADCRYLTGSRPASRSQRARRPSEPAPISFASTSASWTRTASRSARSTADDFELRENGELQAITSFKLVDANGQPTDDLSLPIRSPQHAAAEAARDDVRVFVMFWDEYHIDQFGSAVRAREQLTHFVLEAFGPTDLVALMDQLTPVDALRFTRDRRALADQVHQLRGRRGLYVPARSAIEEAHLRNGQDVERIRVAGDDDRAQERDHAPRHAAPGAQGRRLRQREPRPPRPGRGPRRLRSDPHRQRQQHRDLHRRSARAAGRLRGGFGGGSPMLAALADSTGAEAIVSNDFNAGAAQGGADLERVLPARLLAEGRAARWQVPRDQGARSSRAAVQVRARNGYWAPRGADLDRARAIALAAALPSPVAKAFKELTPDNSRRPAEFWIGLAPASADACEREYRLDAAARASKGAPPRRACW